MVNDKKIPAPLPVGLVAPPPPYRGRKHGGTGIVMSDGHEATREELEGFIADLRVERIPERKP